MSPPPAPLDEGAARAIVDAMVPLLAIPMRPEWRDAVAGNLRALAAASALVTEFPLDDEVEPAPVFRA